MREFFLRTLALAHKEALHMLRDRQVIFLALGMPLVLVLLFGYAVSFDVEEVEVAAVDEDMTPASRSFLARVEASDAFHITMHLASAQPAESLFRRSRIKAVFVVPRGFERALVREDAAEIQLIIDGADGTSARVIEAYGSALALFTTADLIASIRSATSDTPLFEPRIRMWFNPRMESAVFVVPGLVAVVLAIITVLLSGLTVAREWERGSMEQLFATPVGRLSIILGKVAPYVGLGFLQFLLILVAGAYLFEIPLHGSFLTLVLAVFLFLVAALGQGVFISMATKSQQLAVQIGAISSILPSLLISGFLFPIANMPLPLRIVSRFVPARYFIACLRGVLLQGRGVSTLWPQLLGLAGLSIGIIAIATRRFRRRLD
ncbi:MAG: ABC transporter permease [Deltaproteobacteria bacterium]|nr:ABC transporter permease [Deltaproteobacteria bacterium]